MIFLHRRPKERIVKKAAEIFKQVLPLLSDWFMIRDIRVSDDREYFEFICKACAPRTSILSLHDLEKALKKAREETWYKVDMTAINECQITKDGKAFRIRTFVGQCQRCYICYWLKSYKRDREYEYTHRMGR
jgi:hypothetical protein